MTDPCPSVHRQVVLPAATDVDMDAAPYDLKSLKAPVLYGWRLALFVKFAVKSFVWNFIVPKVRLRSADPPSHRSGALATRGREASASQHR